MTHSKFQANDPSAVAAARPGDSADGAAAAEPPLRTPWGDPDISGVWNNGTVTPLERLPSMGDRTHYTEEEAAALRGTGVEQILAFASGTAEGQLTGELNDVWLAPGQEVVRSLRNSLVIDPPDGKIPFTPAGRGRRMQGLLLRAPNAPADAPEVRHVMERCLMTGFMYEPNPFYLNHHEFIQTRDYVVLHSELLGDRRIVPLVDRAPLQPDFKTLGGSSKGYWDGETLVVETSGFDGRSVPFGATADLNITERFTRVDEDTLDYQATYTDPASYTQPWTLENTLRSMAGPIYEFACAEGNYGFGGILRGARVQEREKQAAGESSGAGDSP